MCWAATSSNKWGYPLGYPHSLVGVPQAPDWPLPHLPEHAFGVRSTAPSTKAKQYRPLGTIPCRRSRRQLRRMYGYSPAGGALVCHSLTALRKGPAVGNHADTGEQTECAKRFAPPVHQRHFFKRCTCTRSIIHLRKKHPAGTLAPLVMPVFAGNLMEKE